MAKPYVMWARKSAEVTCGKTFQPKRIFPPNPLPTMSVAYM